MPARNILRLTLWLKFSSGRGRENLAAAAPQRAGRHAGARAAGAFLAPRLLVRLLMSPRAFCARVPWRALARYAVTTWCTSDSLYSRPNSASDAATLAVACPGR